LFALLAAASFATLLWQWGMAALYPVHRRAAVSASGPPVTVLKPLKGREPQTEACLRSWFEQEYDAPAQILFGVASEDDPVCPLVRRLLEQYPGRDAQLVVCGEKLGANAKVSSLIQLQRVARHGVLVISDADVKVARDFLTQLSAALAAPGVGLVNCLYALANPATPAMRWEAVAINADFWSQVLQSRALGPLDFALGAVMALRRESLEAMGGFTVLADYLADDFQLGNRLAKAGLRVILSPLVAECWSGPMTWRQVWDHQLRWARTIRFSKPLPYALSIISNPTIWPLAWLLASPDSRTAWIILGMLAARALAAQDLQRRLIRRWPGTPYMALLKDLLGLAIWICSWFGSQVQWRGTRFQVLPGGKLRALGAVTK
jgi:ceramide glucosyltransferase